MIQYQRPVDLMTRVCVPHVCRSVVLHTAHGDSVLTGHPGMQRTTANVPRSYWWSGLHRDVEHFVRSCRTCAAAKSCAKEVTSLCHLYFCDITCAPTAFCRHDKS